MELSCRVTAEKGILPVFEWSASDGKIIETVVAGEADFHAPEEPVEVTVNVTAVLDGKRIDRSILIVVLEAGALKTEASILFEVDTATLNGVWVTPDNPSEDFSPPLRIKGTFRYDEDTGAAFSGGSWPAYDMRDDGLRGDRIAGDGIWSIHFNYEKSDARVYFAFDDASEFRVEYESGLAWRMKIEWIELDGFPDDHSNPAFIPDSDHIIRWDSAMAGALYGPRSE